MSVQFKVSGETEHIQLEAADTVVAVRERLARLRGRRVLLVWPADGALFRRKLDLVLIQREAYRRAIQLALVFPRQGRHRPGCRTQHQLLPVDRGERE